jgi:ectoine hydroxylase-related dioxygenase (phytanoyl-CoA dioxygenase family)
MTDAASLRGALAPRLDAESGRAAARDVRDAPAIAFHADGRAWRFVPGGETIGIESGDDAPTVVALDAAAWDDFATERATGAGLLYGGRVSFERGDQAALERWEPALRALFDGRPIFDPIADPVGAIDCAWRGTLDDTDETLRRFLYATGYLHVRGVFGLDEIARLRDAVEARQVVARPGDGRSWWATTSSGAQVLCRLIYLGLDVAAIAALNDDLRLRRLASLVREPLRPVSDRSDGHSLVIKNADVVAGLSDLPWHRDCGLGGHPLTCPTLNVGIQLDAATEATGRLCFVPGSWRYSCHRSDLARAKTVAIDTEPGDVTVHFGDTMHAAPPPTGAGQGRRALYIGWMPSRAYDAIPPGRSYNDVIIRHVGGRSRGEP